jgi:8-demethyl-8-alpha-L-rhamnosyltetracenomycin-C 2'-O-methyltransferase
MVTLDELANKHLTDKGSQYPGGSRHGYADIYDPQYLSKWRDEPIRFLEIGISLEPTWGGQSVNMWYEYFTKAEIFTMDILDMSQHPCIVNQQDRVRFYRADQSKREDLKAMYESFGSKPFDCILEDGSHEHNHQMISYIIEDVSIPEHEVCCIRNDKTYRAMKDLLLTGKLDSKFVLPEEKAYIENNIKSIEIHPDIQDAYSVVIITKK